MKHSILDTLSKHGYETQHLIDDPLIIKIDELIKNNNCLSVTFTDDGIVLLKKKLKYKYNIKFQILNKPNGWIIRDELLGKMGIPINSSYIYEGIVKILNRNENNTNLSDEELRIMKEKKELEDERHTKALKEHLLNQINKNKNNLPPKPDKEIYKDYINPSDNFENPIDDDPFSERSIMRDLENGEGEKHGF